MNSKKNTLKEKLGIECIISAEMMNAVRSWKKAYENKSDWLNDQVKSLELPSSVASEIARIVTVENEINVSGSLKADTISQSLDYFRKNKKNIIEIACATGGMYFKPKFSNGKITIDYIYQDEAIPFKFFNEGMITGVVFPSYFVKDKKRYTLLEVHNFSNEKYTIENHCFVSKEIKINDIFNMELGNEISLDSVEEWKDLEQIIVVEGAEKPFYSYFKIPLANNIDRKCPLGVSVYSRALNDIKGADIQMARLDWEYEAKEAAIDVDESYFKQDAYGHTIMPKGKERLYRQYQGESFSENGKLFNEYSPDIRDQSFINGLNKRKQEIEFKCGLAYGTISDPNMVDKTAEEIKSSKQRSYQQVNDIQGSLEESLRGLITSIEEMMSGYGIIEDNGKVDVSFVWDDSIVVDSKAEKQQDVQDVNLGVMSKWEYRMKWYGESEEVAKQRIAEMNANKPGMNDLFNEGDE